MCTERNLESEVCLQEYGHMQASLTLLGQTGARVVKLGHARLAFTRLAFGHYGNYVEAWAGH